MPRKGSRPFHVTIIRYLDSAGKRCSKSTPGARKVKERSDTFYAKLSGKTVSLETTDEGEAWANLRRLLKRASDERAGIRDRHTDAAEQPFAVHVDDWIASVRARGASEGHLRVLKSRVLKLARIARWRSIADIDEDSCNAALSTLQTQAERTAHRDNAGQARGLSAQTRNHYTRHVKQFTRWLSRGKGRRLPEDPLSGVDTVKVEHDRRHDRRAPTEEEVLLLFGWLEDPNARTAFRNRVPFRSGMTAAHRAVGYKVSMATGYRASELKSLRTASFDLEAGTVSVRAAYSKNRRFDAKHLPAWIVEELRAWLAAGNALAWPFPRLNPGDVLRRDLRDARAAWIGQATGKERKAREQSTTLLYEIPGPNGPLFWDFHSLRHYYVTQVVNAPNVSPKIMMVLCRLSSPDLALKVYGKIREQSELKSVVDSLPRPGTKTK